MSGKHEKPSPDDIPQTITDERWDQICAAADDALSARPDKGIGHGATANAAARNSQWN